MIRKFGLLTMLVVLGTVGVMGVAAEGTVVVDTEEYGHVTLFTDGRINSSDVAAPVVIYYKSQAVPALDEQGQYVWGRAGIFYEDVYTGIELLEVQADGASSLVLAATADDIQTALAASETQIVGTNGYTLNMSENGWFWVSGPADSEGKAYTFSWDDYGRLLTVDE